LAKYFKAARLGRGAVVSPLQGEHLRRAAFSQMASCLGADTYFIYTSLFTIKW